ncbi:replication-associated recombination protein A [Patescibacteria group bacterium]|nr:replication-associated recombination protein A [Patescibacteria group bacterium]
MDLFDAKMNTLPKGVPLADRIRPTTLSEYEGQLGAIGEGTWLKQAIEQDSLPSLVLWGPPGVGKTTLARIIATLTKARFVPFSAVGGSITDVRAVIKDAEERRKFYGERTTLFVDEIHRFNKAQQDAFLPAVEKGIVTFIGATTENPSFEVNAALLSRCRVVVLEQLPEEALVRILQRALNESEKGLGKLGVTADKAALGFLAATASGDARSALNALEIAATTTKNKKITKELVADVLKKNAVLYDKGGEEHYNIISALHKSMRGGDAGAAMYWLGRMLEGGEDPLYITRRLVRFASEDIGLADPQALVQAVAAHQAAHAIGMPECNVVLSQCVAYLAKAPKSNALYVGYAKVKQDIAELPNEPVPIHLRNAPTKLMKELGYGKNYKYTPAFENAEDAKQDYLPDRLKKRKYL